MNGGPEVECGGGLRSGWRTLAIFTMVGAVLRLVGINHGLWFDEIVTVIDSLRPPLVQVLTGLKNVNNHPLYSVMGQLSVAVLGEHPWSVRLPAVLFGVAGIPMLYLLGSGVTSRFEALLASAFLTVSYHHVWFSQNARGYSALAFWVLLATWLLLRGLARTEWWWSVGYGTTLGLGMYTHLTMAFVAITHVLICAGVLARDRAQADATRRRRKFASAFLLGGGLTLLCYSPYFGDLWLFYRPYVDDVWRTLTVATEAPAPTQTAGTSWAVQEALSGLRTGFGLAGLAGGVALVLCGLWSYLRSSRLVAVLFVVPGALLGLVLVVLQYPMRPRFFFFLIGFGALILVRGAVVLGGRLAVATRLSIDRRQAATVGGSVLVGMMLLASAVSLGYGYRFPKQDFEGAMEFVEDAGSPDDLVIVAGLVPEFAYRQYYERQWESVETPEALEGIKAAAAGRVWLIYTFPEHIPPDLMAAITRDCPPVKVFRGTVGDGDMIVCQVR